MNPQNYSKFQTSTIKNIIITLWGELIIKSIQIYNKFSFNNFHVRIKHLSCDSQVAVINETILVYYKDCIFGTIVCTYIYKRCFYEKLVI